ncbi:hypothetical protein ATE84_1300 [Aquimarina sp. MAR_2010_214]|uniref:hypothetical protein n=1 Tax=Aquimarina sp. MAR_2010_214 TaxID=1250026 RepID=UPI000C71014D|nr:hypothetical protein [Aquimarina sp. MAR_2010_214]PKV49279.1 hypothetical protein ATE84_1300 [Aquimarina sp. MAR_2010_214]
MIKSKRDATIALTFFLLAAALGVFLRSLYVFDISFDYRYIVHAHSHIALLGWVYVGLTTLLYKLYLNDCNVGKRYNIIFWFTQFTLLGMLFSFPFQGYALFSITFSTLFLFTSYWFTWFFVKNIPEKFKNTKSYKCIKIALWYMVVSSIGPWALGAIMSTLGTDSIWYRLAIYFYLHFQYNGWMILALFGLLFFVLELREIKISDKHFNRFSWAINLGVILSFFLSVLWTKPAGIYYILGGVGGLFQIIAFMLFVELLMKSKTILSNIFSGFQKKLLKTVGILIIIKFLLQLISAFPYVANLATTVLDFTIGYLHWTFLGVVSIGLFLFLEYFKLIKIPEKGYYIYLLGFALTEVLIFYKGAVIWLDFIFFEHYFIALSIASVVILIGISSFFVANLRLIIKHDNA